METKRLNIALLISELEDGFCRDVCEGANSAAKEIDANLFIFPGKYIDAVYHDIYRTGYDYQFNSLFHYAKLNEMDAFVVTMGTICSHISAEKSLQFLMQFDKPVIIISAKTKGFPNVYFDNKSGFKEGIRHLIKEHGRRNIGFVSGPATNEDSKERFAAYREALKECGIPYDEKYIAYGNFSQYSEEVVYSLLKQNPSLDAVVFANDLMAIGGYQVFKELGLDVGEDISVLGFDDADCALTLEPNLSTIKADPVNLGYEAIIHMEDILSGDINEIVVPTIPVYRASCGCRKRYATDFDVTKEEMFDPQKREEVLFKTYEYLLGRNINQPKMAALKSSISEFYTLITQTIVTEEAQEQDFRRLFHMMRNMLYMNLEPYTSIAKLSGVFSGTYHILRHSISKEKNLRMLSENFCLLFANMAEHENQRAITNEKEFDLLNYVTTTFTRDIMNFSIGDDRAYFSVMEKLKSLHYISAYLCLFPDKVIHKKDEPYEIPEDILIKTYIDRSEMGWLEAEEQRTNFKNLVTDLYCEREDRVTVIVNLLFSTLEQYGILISELEEGYLHNSIPIAYQMSATVKTVELLKDNASMMEQLKENIEEIKEKNQILDEISKSDELTQIYNRRGFLTMAQRKISHRANKGKKAFVIYADMNNLKIINDRFGHEEGDYSLKLIAEILKDSLDEESIIGRFGGDEFVAFSYVPEEKTARSVRKTINDVTKMKNEGNGKPYYVSMSVGICEFECGRDVDMDDLMDKADVDLYIEKKHKRSNVLKNENEAI